MEVNGHFVPLEANVQDVEQIPGPAWIWCQREKSFLYQESKPNGEFT